MPNRIIQSAILSSASLSRVSLEADLMFRCLLNYVDDFGRCDGRPLTLRAALYPARSDIMLKQIERWIEELRGADGPNDGPVEYYWVADLPYIQLRNYERHRAKQRRAKTSKLPGPEDGATEAPVTSPEILGNPRKSGERSRSVTKPPSDSALMLTARFRAYMGTRHPGRRCPPAPALPWARMMDALLDDPQRKPPATAQEVADTIDWLRDENPKRECRYVVLAPSSLLKKYDAIRAEMEVPHATPAISRRDNVRTVLQRWSQADLTPKPDGFAGTTTHDRQTIHVVPPLGDSRP